VYRVSRTGIAGVFLFTLAIALGALSAHADTAPWPTDGWPTAQPESVGLDSALLAEAAAYAQAYGGAGLVVRQGFVVAAWGDTRLRYELKSTTKSIGATALGLAIGDGLLALDDQAIVHLPAFGTPPSDNSATGWLDDITLLQLATHTAGFAKSGGYTELLHAPGSAWLYSDGGFNWLADVLTTIFDEDLNSVLFRRVFAPLGIVSADLVWRSNAFREDTLAGIKRREFGSGIRANVDAMARIGYLYLRGGVWEGEAILPPAFAAAVRQPSPQVIGLPVVGGSNPPATSSRYGVGWFTNSDGALPEVPRDAFWAWGLLDSLIVVIPSLDIVIARTGNGLGRQGWNADYSYIAPFITPIARSATVPGEGIQVPQLVGMMLPDAVSALAALGLNASPVTEVPSALAPAGVILAQAPSPSAWVPAGSDVGLTVSTGVGVAVVPELVGLSENAAIASLTASGFVLGDTTRIPSTTAPAGHVVDQDPEAGTEAPTGAAISLAVSAGPAETSAWLEFDGINDVVTARNSPALRIADAITIEARIRPHTIAANKSQDRILRKGVDYELMVSTSSAGCSGPTRGSLQLSATVGGAVKKICGGTLTLNAWQHVAGTYDGTRMSIYIDGNLVAELEVTGAIKRSSTLVTMGNTKALTRPFDGGIADVAVWNRALTPAEALARVNNSLTGAESGLVAYWAAREGSGQSVRDGTPHANHGQLGLTDTTEPADPLWAR
jgi:CubicO group peptidase (beta-lactamase class C family)